MSTDSVYKVIEIVGTSADSWEAATALAGRRLAERAHADVVIEEIDFFHILAEIAAEEPVIEDVEPQTVRVLRREHRQIPERQKIERQHHARERDEQEPVPHTDRLS